MTGRFLLVALFAVALASAQDEGGAGGGGGFGGGGGRGGGMGGGMGMEGGGMPRVQRMTPLEMLADKLKLNKEQKDELLKILAAGREEASQFLQPLEAERANLANAILNSNAEAQKKALEAFSAMRAQIVGVEAKAFTKIYAMLKPNQQGKAAQSFELLAGMFDAPAGARGGMGRGMGRGGRN